MLRFVHLLLTFLALAAGQSLAAEQHHRACIAQFGASCGGTDAFFNCGTSVDGAAQAICTIHTDRGIQRYPFTAKVIKDIAGGRCGLATVDVVCHGMPDDSVPTWHYDNCQAGRRQMCPGNYRFFDCDPTPDQIAQNYCAQAGSPWQVFSYYTVGGGRCGKSLYSVACHMPR